jgi:hypothetical protein
MPLATSDAAFEILAVGRDGIRFRLGIFESGGPTQDGGTEPAERHVWIQAASPPPTRDGFPWYDGLLLKDDSAEKPRPFEPVAHDTEDAWRHHGITWQEDNAPLDPPSPHTLVLDQGIRLPRVHGETMSFAESSDPLAFVSTRYPQPDRGRVPVRYLGEFELIWKRPLAPGSYVAISTERFEFGRISADLITQVRRRNLFHPPRPKDESVEGLSESVQKPTW